MYKDGICHVKDNLYSMTIQFGNTNYTLADFEEKTGIFQGFSNLINSFDSSVRFQFTYENQSRNQDELLKKIIIPEQNDAFNDIRTEYSGMLADNIKSDRNGNEILKFLTFSIEAGSYKSAKVRMETIQNQILKSFGHIGVEAEVLSGKERLRTMYYSLNPFRKQNFIFDWLCILCPHKLLSCR